MTSTLRRFIRQVLLETPRIGAKKLRVFDFDDTLVKTNSMVHVTDPLGRSFDLTPGEYAVYDRRPGDVFDYSDFDALVSPREIAWTGKILRNVLEAGSEAVILTARGSARPVRQFLQDAQLPQIEVIALGDSNPEKKAEYIASRIDEDGFDYVEFFDDSYKNIEAVRSLRASHPDVRIVVRHVVSKPEFS